VPHAKSMRRPIKKPHPLQSL